MFWKNQPLVIAPHLAGSIEALAAKPRPKITTQNSDRRAAEIDLTGVLDPDYLSDWRRDVVAMGNSDRAGWLVVAVDSPGGALHGVPETAEVIRRIAERKPVHVVAQNYLCSGAYWICSQATTITATPSTYVGALGSYIVLLDESAAAAAMGVKVLVVRSGAHKGAGTPGEPIEPEHIAMYQRLVDYSSAMFMADVGRGRKFKTVAAVSKVFTGEIWHGGLAKTQGLIDREALFEDRFDELAVVDHQSISEYAGLTGQAALDRWEQLVLAEGNAIPFKLGVDRWDVARTQLEEKYPALAAAVAAAESSLGEEIIDT